MIFVSIKVEDNNPGNPIILVILVLTLYRFQPGMKIAAKRHKKSRSIGWLPASVPMWALGIRQKDKSASHCHAHSFANCQLLLMHQKSQIVMHRAHFSFFCGVLRTYLKRLRRFHP
jgi:hypothetical protein